MPVQDIKDTIEESFRDIRSEADGYEAQFNTEETGTVTGISAGVARVSGLNGAGSEELLEFANGMFGIAFNLDEESIGVVLLGNSDNIRAGDRVKRTGRIMDVPVGDELLGRVLNPLGVPLDGKEGFEGLDRLPVERTATPIMDRKGVARPLQTGIKVIDALIPVGRGQRELILGDRQTGKTTIAVDTILNQKEEGMVCVYCAIGQRAASITKVLAELKEHDALKYTIIVVTEGNDAPGLQYVAPYAATSIAEHFMEQGKDVLIIYDDLTHHARAYRELSLLLRRPPGREAFPGDIFYIHSRLLERSTQLNEDRGGGSLTALPIIETEAQNISAYIPTNLISITDGQIYLSPKLFDLGVLPAVDVGKSVSRVGGKAQLPAYRNLAGNLKLKYSQFEELETFTRFGTKLDKSTQETIDHGRRIRASFIQPEMHPITVAEQLLLLTALNKGLLDPVPLPKMAEAEKALRKSVNDLPDHLQEKLKKGEKLSEEDDEVIVEKAGQILASFKEDEDSPKEKE